MREAAAGPDSRGAGGRALQPGGSGGLAAAAAKCPKGTCPFYLSDGTLVTSATGSLRAHALTHANLLPRPARTPQLAVSNALELRWSLWQDSLNIPWSTKATSGVVGTRCPAGHDQGRVARQGPHRVGAAEGVKVRPCVLRVNPDILARQLVSMHVVLHDGLQGWADGLGMGRAAAECRAPACVVRVACSCAVAWF